jgi:hypothetical protein
VSDLLERCHRMKSKKRISIFSGNGKNHAQRSEAEHQFFLGNGKIMRNVVKQSINFSFE